MPPPTQPGPLLLALLAFQRGWITRERLLEATGLWMGAPAMDVGKLLVDARDLSEAQRAELEGLVAEWLQARGGATVTPALRETLALLRRPSPRPATAAPAVRADKYELGPELGRGGVGRVVEATDRELGRSVALKLMLEDAPLDLVERFKWEARITGRFDHPNIVTVHEVGNLPGSKELFFAMKKIVGKDLGWAIAEGQPLRKLVEAVRDACRAVAYAHSKGVIHRDLKPANIMLGDFGEVLVVDWGLARLLGEEDTASQIRRASSAAARPGRIAKQEETANLTLEGDILGTPSYMPPEQAMGWLTAIDERSDVYSLGATLYEVLTGVPPYDGPDAREVVEKVVKGPLDPPSKFRVCPPELEAICLRAMAYQAGERYPTARALQADLDAWLEGALENERRGHIAAQRIEAGKAALEAWRDLAQQAEDAARHAEEAARRAPAHLPLEGYREIHALEDRAREVELKSLEALADADDAFDGALSLLPDHGEARRLKAEVHWEKLLAAERAQDWRNEYLARRRVETYNDGAFDERLKGEGLLEVRTRAYPCACLREGRPVRPEELVFAGYHPWSGRFLDGRDVDSVPEVEPAAPVPLRVHAATCAPQPLAGAEVWAFRFEPADRILVPTTPPDAPSGPPVPAAVLDALYGRSPYRPRGPGIHLGRTPVSKRPWPRGSWLLVVSAPDRAPQRIPVEVRRGTDAIVDATLFFPQEVPPGHLPVLGGRFESLSEAGEPELTRQVVNLEDAFVARFPVTCAEYCTFLNEIDGGDPGAARARSPRGEERSSWWWTRGSSGWAVPTDAWLRTASDLDRARVSRLPSCDADWLEDWPVFGISWVDMAHYVRRLSAGRGWLFALPTVPLRERAARGDGHRRFAWGDAAIPLLANTNQARQGVQQPEPVDSFPWDESPWGARGVIGNASERCLSSPGPSWRNWRFIRGSAWNRVLPVGRTSYRQGAPILATSSSVGFRTAAVVRLDPEERR
ncbi:MAG: protein kinase [Planctomycetia bacterium]|nr:protein kinase [Planctomycetia bacterium]